MEVGKESGSVDEWTNLMEKSCDFDRAVISDYAKIISSLYKNLANLVGHIIL